MNRFLFFIFFLSYLIADSSDSQSLYTSELNSSSPTFMRTACFGEYHFYEAIEMKVIETGNYSLGSNSSMDTYGYIYENSFNPTYADENLLSEDDQSYRNNQFKLVIRLQVNTTYILVMTTYSPNIRGMFTIIAIGPNNVSFNHFSKFF